MSEEKKVKVCLNFINPKFHLDRFYIEAVPGFTLPCWSQNFILFSQANYLVKFASNLIEHVDKNIFSKILCIFF